MFLSVLFELKIWRMTIGFQLLLWFFLSLKKQRILLLQYVIIGVTEIMKIF